MRVIIIEDEEVAARTVRRMINEYDSEIDILCTLKSISSVVKWFSNNAAPDLIFMDIQLSDGKCFEIFSQIEISTPVIFTTAFDEYAIKAFEINSIHYLLKPISQEKLTKAIDKYKKVDQLKPGNIDIYKFIEASMNKYKDRFLVKLGQQLIPIEISEISYFIKDELVYLVTSDNRKYPINYSLDELERILNPSNFFRINRQFITRVSAIKKIHQHFKGRLKIELYPATDTEIIISQEKVAPFKDFMNT